MTLEGRVSDHYLLMKKSEGALMTNTSIEDHMSKLLRERLKLCLKDFQKQDLVELA